MVLSLILVVFPLIAYAPAIVPSLKPYMGYSQNWEQFTLRLIFILAAITPLIVLMCFSENQAEDLEPISKADCFDIAKGLNQPLIANYCAQVASQGRELVAGEYDAIIQQIQLKEAESLKPQEAELEAACKKVYGVATS